MARLGDVCEVNPRAPRDIADDTVVSFLPMSGVSEGGFVSIEELRTYKDVKKGYTYFERGDVLVAKITPCFENGKAALADKISSQLGFGSTEFHVVRPSPGVDAKYVFYLLWNDKFRAVAEKGMTGSAGQKRVPADLLKRLEIPLPPLDEQKRIAAILDKADLLRQKRRQAITLLDSLTQSIFQEMFGDVEAGYPTVKLAEVTHRITDGVHQKPNYTDNGTPFISVKDITTGRLIFEKCKFISQDDHQKYTKRCKPEKGDILYTKVGATYGRPALIDTEIEFSIYVSVALIKPDRKRIRPKFLNALMATDLVKSQANRCIKGIGVPDLHLDQIQGFRVPLPPLAKQVEFEAIVDSLELNSRLNDSSLQSLDVGFASLQHRAFSGQL
nr:restriction endonuclease subunit S [Rhizobium soli]